MGEHGGLKVDKFIKPVIYKIEQVKTDGAIRDGLYFKDDNGRDWYDTLKKWKGAVSADENNIVVACETDPSFMGVTEGRNIYEVDAKDIPPNALGKYTFDNGVFTLIRPDAVVVAEQQKASLMALANAAIAPLQDAVDLSMATDDEIAQLTAWKQYRVLLNRVDTSAAPDITWPVKPVSD